MKKAPPRRSMPKTRMGMNKNHEKMEPAAYEDKEEMMMASMPMMKGPKKVT